MEVKNYTEELIKIDETFMNVITNYKTLFNHILNAGFYWEAYEVSVQEFLNNLDLHQFFLL